MKKILSIIFSSVLLLNTVSWTSFASSDKNILWDAIENSFKSNYMQIGLGWDIYFWDSEISFEWVQKYEKNKINENVSVDVSIDSSDFEQSLWDDYYEFTLDWWVSFDSYVDLDTLDVFFKFSDVYVNTDTEDKNVKAILEWTVETTKIFSDKYYYLWLSEFFDSYIEMGVINKNEVDSIKSYLSNMWKEQWAEMFRLLFDANIFTVEKMSSTKYKTTLNPNISDMDFWNIIEFLEKDAMTEDIAKTLKMQLSQLSENDINEMQAMYSSFSSFYDFAIYFELNNYWKLSDMSLNLDILVENFIWNDIKIKTEMDFSYNLVSVNFPEKVSSEVVNFSKIFKMIEATTALSKSYYDSYDDYDYNDNYDYSTYWEDYYGYSGWSEWYSESLNRFNNDWFYFKNSWNVNSSLSIDEFNNFLYLSSNLYTNNWNQEWYVTWKNKNSPVNKLIWISIIIKEFVPEVKNPIRWAMSNWILSEDFSPKNANSKNITKAEFVYVLYKVVDYYLLTYDY